jgi:hypothetical protein
MRCEGWRRNGGVFTFGPVTWSQCKSKATVKLTITQDGKTKTFPACTECWKEAQQPQWKIKIKKAVPL